MKTISALGAAALLALGLYGSASAVAIGAPVAAEVEEQVCPGDKIDVVGNQPSVTVTAPEGMVIVGYCVKAGSAQQGDGPEFVVVDPPATEVTITHSTGKDVSHYSVTYAPAPTPTPTPTEPTPQPTPTEPTDQPTPTEKPTPVSPPALSPPMSELASTGPAETIGYSMLALAMIGGGIAFIVLARRRLT